MAVGNNSYEEMIGLYTAGYEITRQASRMARGLVTIQSRLNQTVDEGSSTGKALTEWYKEHNIAIFDQQGQLMSLYDVLGQVAQIWDSLSTNEKDYYLNQQAGANQTQNLAAILSNYETALRATETALNANGSAMRQNAVYMESLEAKSNQLKATFQDLANNIVSKDLVSGALTALNSILEVLDTTAGRFITTTVLLTGALGGLGSLIMLYLRSFGAIETITGALTGKLWLVVAAIGAVVSAIILLNKTIQANSVEGLTAQIDELNSKLEINKQRLAEINDMGWGNLTPDIIEEKIALEAENIELERNLELKSKALGKKAATQLEGIGIGALGQKAFSYAGLEQMYTVRGSDKMGIELERHTYEEAIELVNKYGGTIEEVADTLQYYNEDVLQIYLDTLSKHNSLIKENGELTDSQTIAYKTNVRSLEEIRNLMETSTSAYKQGVEGAKDYSVELEIINAALEESKRIYTESAFPLQTHIKEQKELAIQAGLTGDALKDKLIDEIIHFNNTNVSVADKIKALKDFGDAAIEAYRSQFILDYLMEHGVSKDAPAYLKEFATERALFEWSQILKSTGITIGGKTHLPSPQDDGGGGGGTTKDTWKEAAEKELSILKSKYEAAEISHQDYIDGMNAINEKYYANRSKYEEEYWELVADIYQETEKLAEEQVKKYKENIKELKATLEIEKEEMEQVAAYMQDYAQQQIDDIDNQIAALKEQNDVLDDQIEKEQLLKNLAEAKQKRKYVFKDGRFQYVEDVEAIGEAQSALDKYEREQEYERQKKALEEQKKQWEEYKNGWSNLSNSYDIEQGKLLALEKYGINAEAKNWNQRLIGLEAFVNQYNKLLSNINYLDAEGNITSVDQIKTITTTTSTKKSGHATAEDILAGKLEGVHLDLSKLERHAQGTVSASGGLTLVGEQGAELVNLPTGSGVIPADITRNLWNFGRNLSSGNVNKSVAISVGNISLPNIKDALGFVNGLKNLAWQYSTQRT